MNLNYDYFYQWARKHVNMDFNSYKQKQLRRRIATVMNSSGAETLEEFARLIESDAKIRENFLDYVTINVTKFYRNKNIFKDFEDVIINILRPRFRELKIWSAACSIGAEPYSLAMILEKNGFGPRSRILATDVDENILKRAREGIFYKHEIDNIDSDDLSYFNIEDGKYLVKDQLKSRIDFKKHDLILDDYPKGYHIVVCRNVVIYFTEEAKNRVYSSISNSLVEGGILFTGATESIYNPKDFGFKKISTFIYEKI